jgi:hypothetical protein
VIHPARSTSARTRTLVGPSGPAVHDAQSPRQPDVTSRLTGTGRYHVDVVSATRTSIAAPASGIAATCAANCSAARV